MSLKMCYENCGCLPDKCLWGLRTVDSSALPVPAVVHARPLFLFGGWMRLPAHLSVTEPLVIITDAYPEPLVLLPRLSAMTQAAFLDKRGFVVPFSLWERSGCPNYAHVLYWDAMRLRSTGLWRKLMAADSWYQSAVPMVKIVVYNFVEADITVPQHMWIETTERLMARGWDGLRRIAWLRKEKVRLSWWKTFCRQLVSPKQGSLLQVLWAAISPWTPFWKPRLSQQGGLFLLPWTGTRVEKLSERFPDLNVWHRRHSEP